MMNKGISHISSVAGGIMILSGLLASGCNRDKEVLSEKKMVELITDLKLAEAYSNSQMGGPNHSGDREQLANSVLAEHKVTKEQLDSTLGWYGRNLDKYAELYEKVDKRILEKRKRLMKDTEGVDPMKRGDNMWPYGNNGVISTLGTSDGWILSINSPEIQQGDRLEWSMHLKDIAQPMTGVLGVEYTDGTAEAVTSHFTNRQQIELSFQTDTAKIVERIYGTLRRKSQDRQPLFVDSIMLRKLPFDSLEFNKFRSQKKYGYPVRVTKADRIEKAKADSLRRDSIKHANELREETLESTEETEPTSISDKPAKTARPLRPGKNPVPASSDNRSVKAVPSESKIRKAN